MLTANQLRQVAAGSGARDIGNVEIDVILTCLPQLFSEKGVTDHVAFKGGTMLRKMVFGPRGRLAPENIEGARPAGSPGHAGTGPLLRYSPASGRRWPFWRALLRASNPAGGVLSILEQPRRLAHLLPNCLLSTRRQHAPRRGGHWEHLRGISGGCAGRSAPRPGFYRPIVLKPSHGKRQTK